jgi:hypothetical protein
MLIGLAARPRERQPSVKSILTITVRWHALREGIGGECIHSDPNIPHHARRVSSGRNLFAEGGDGRTAWGRRWRDLCLSHANDLGGADILSEAQVSIIKRASAMECELEALEARLSEGQPIDVGQYSRLAGLLCRLLELVGVRRLSKSLDPTSELVRAMSAYASQPVDDEDEPPPVEEGEAQ